MRQRKFNKRNRLPKFLLFVFLAALLGVGIYLFIFSGLFTIKSVEVEAVQINCADEKRLKEASVLLGQNIFLINSAKTENTLKKIFICIKSIKVAKNFPDKVRVQIFGRQAVAQLISLKDREATPSALIDNIATPSAEEIIDSYMVDNEGVAFAKTNGELDAPKIYMYNNLKSDLIARSLKILDKTLLFGVKISDAWIKDDTFSINLLSGGPKIIFRLSGEIDIQIASLQLILEKAKIDESRLEFIDLRFDKPIVRFAPKKNG